MLVNARVAVIGMLPALPDEPRLRSGRRRPRPTAGSISAAGTKRPSTTSTRSRQARRSTARRSWSRPPRRSCFAPQTDRPRQDSAGSTSRSASGEAAAASAFSTGLACRGNNLSATMRCPLDAEQPGPGHLGQHHRAFEQLDRKLGITEERDELPLLLERPFDPLFRRQSLEAVAVARPEPRPQREALRAQRLADVGGKRAVSSTASLPAVSGTAPAAARRPARARSRLRRNSRRASARIPPPPLHPRASGRMRRRRGWRRRRGEARRCHRPRPRSGANSRMFRREAGHRPPSRRRSCGWRGVPWPRPCSRAGGEFLAGSIGGQVADHRRTSPGARATALIAFASRMPPDSARPERYAFAELMTPSRMASNRASISSATAFATSATSPGRSGCPTFCQCFR